MIARKRKTPKKLPESSDHFPFLSKEAKATHEEIMKKKTVMRERVLAWNSPQANPEIKEIIQNLHWEEPCASPGDAIMPIVKEFYSNLQSDEDGKVFVRGRWVDASSQAINKLLKTPNYGIDEYFKLTTKGVNEEELANTLCQQGKKVTWTQGKHAKRNFHIDALQPRWMPLFKFICSRLIPTTHISDVTIDRAVLLYAMIKNLDVDVDVGSLIQSAMGKAIMHSKALLYLALVTRLCVNAKVQAGEEEQKMKPVQTISAKLKEEQVQFGGQKLTHKVLTEMKKIKENQEKLLALAQRQQEWNKIMMQKCSSSSDFPTFQFVFAGTSQVGPSNVGPSKEPLPAQVEPKRKSLEKPATPTSEEEDDEEE